MCIRDRSTRLARASRAEPAWVSPSSSTSSRPTAGASGLRAFLAKAFRFTSLCRWYKNLLLRSLCQLLSRLSAVRAQIIEIAARRACSCLGRRSKISLNSNARNIRPRQWIAAVKTAREREVKKTFVAILFVMLAVSAAQALSLIHI